MVLATAMSVAVVGALVGDGGSDAAAPASFTRSSTVAPAAVGSPVSGMNPVAITGPVRTWAEVQQLVAGVQAANPGVDQVKITYYVLMGIQGDQWTWFVSWTGASTTAAAAVDTAQAASVK